MRVFIHEFITGGGLLGEELPLTLAREAAMMVEALARDLAQVRGVSVMVGQDPRVDLPKIDAAWLIPKRGESADELLQRGLRLCDAVWPIAPETDGVLERITRAILAADKVLLGSQPDAVRICASKYETARYLHGAGVACVDTWRADEVAADTNGAWVVKPDDGAGALGTYVLADSAALKAFLVDNGAQRCVVQPWVEGPSLSLSLLCKQGRATLLSVNEQHLFLQDRTLTVDALVVNARPTPDERFEKLAHAVAAALPGLWGYVGVDVVDDGDDLRVLDVNPRLTTSYCGLREALNANVAQLAFNLLKRDDLEPWIGARGKPVEINLSMDYGG
jgi:tyramine---L-glutamate ligase